MFDLKFLVNKTANLLGIDTNIPRKLDKIEPDDTVNVLKSMFQYWNPKASSWATKVSKTFKKLVTEKPEPANKFTPWQYEKIQQINLSACGCSRAILTRGPLRGSANDSTCSQDSFLRGPGQRVIGFSFYGDPNTSKAKKRKYFKGIMDNVNLIPELYPGWTVRVYYDLEPGSSLLQDLCEFACAHPNLDLCYVSQLPSNTNISKVFAMNWRFFPVMDPQVDVYLSRDLDSRLNPREVSAVNEWLATPKHFHFMRDHPAHRIEVLGSGWGVAMGQTNSRVRRLLYDSFKQAANDPIFWAPRAAYGPDQGFLKRYLWPWGKWSAVSHDAYTCQRFPRTQPFPTRRKLEPNNFVASIVEANDILDIECPVSCRPKQHKDWTYC